MLLLMRRTGEIVRINEKITLEIKEIADDNVTFVIQGMNVSEEEKENTEKESN